MEDFRNIEPTFATSVPANQPRAFSFVTVQNPDELKQKSRQSLIRKHAKQDVDRAKARKHRATIQTLKREQPVQISPAHRNAGSARLASTSLASPSDGKSAANKDRNFQPLPDIEILKPIGAGRGLVPFAPYPVKPSTRDIQLFDFGIPFLNPRGMARANLSSDGARDEERPHDTHVMDQHRHVRPILVQCHSSSLCKPACSSRWN